MDEIRHLKKSYRGRSPGSKNLQVEEVRYALVASRGLIASAARRLGVVRQSIYNALERWPELQEVVGEEREVLLDNAETALHKAVERGEAWAICFTLKTQGKTRGYTERYEVSKTEGHAFQQQKELKFDFRLLTTNEKEVLCRLLEKAKGLCAQTPIELPTS